MNYLIRGRGFPECKTLDVITSKSFTSLYAGLATVYLTHNYIAGLIVFFGMWLGVLFGWTFMAMHGQADNKDKFPPVTFIVDKILGFEELKPSKLYGIVWMTVRSILFFPMFIALWLYLGLNPLYGLLCMSMGVIQYLCGKYVHSNYMVLVYEFVFGSIAVGSALWLTLTT